ncbi:MAG TPA: methionyl-tRNA formyltransferase [Meiothermus sp.]|nr:methionyl-tRNA formyltransferase [Meiothermus sp.]
MSASKPRRVAFFGSPAWAVPVLEALHDQHQVVLVVTQPDKPAGRGLVLTPPAVAQRAEQLGLRVEKPKKLRNNAEFLELVNNLNLDVAVTAAYGKILPADLLEVPRFGFLNLHPSDLPKYRGPAPVQWTLINGDPETAVCVMQTDPGMDTGPVVARWRTRVGPDEDAVGLANRLRERGTQLLLEALQNLEHLRPEPQPTEGTHAPMLEKEDGRVRWRDSAQAIYNRHRGVQPWPGSWFEHEGKRVKVVSMRRSGVRGSGSAGTVLEITSDSVIVAAGEGAIELLEVQPEGKRPMRAADWARGYGVKVGTHLA